VTCPTGAAISGRYLEQPTRPEAASTPISAND